MDWYPWIVTLHVLGAFLFVFGHGASAFAGLRLRRERDPVRIGAMLEVSTASYLAMGIGWVVLLAAGLIATFVGGLWGRPWIWISLVLFVVLTGYMTPRAAGWMREVRHAVGMKVPYVEPKDAPPPTPASAAELEAILTSPRMFEVTAVGGIGLGIIIALMVLKPF
jgi:energy-coupling factor transporter transmembrane protein EcfT